CARPPYCRHNRVDDRSFADMPADQIRSAPTRVRAPRKRKQRPIFGGRRRSGRNRRRVLLASAIWGLTALSLAAIGAEFARGLRTGIPTAVAPHYKVGAPYRIDGVWYRPTENFDYRRIGIASFYGGETHGVDFHGRATANGEIYDMYA